MTDSKGIKFKKLLVPQGQDKVKIDQIFEVDTRYGIIMAVDNFGSLNIKKLAKILGKNEATIHHHVKWLTQEPTMLDIDQKKTMNTKGIFYQLSNTAKQYRQVLGLSTSEENESVIPDRKGSDKIADLLDLSVEELAEIHMQLIKKIAGKDGLVKEKRLVTYNHVLEDIMLQNIDQAVIALNADKKPKNPKYPFGAISNFSLDMKVSNIRHLYLVLHKITKFIEDFQELKQKIANEIEGEAIEEDDLIDLHFHLVGGEIAEFEFMD